MIRYLLQILLVFSFGFLSCQKDNPGPNSNKVVQNNEMQAPYQYSYLALGDSYTIGQGVPESDQWGVRLAEMLRANKINVGNPTTIARTGWTTGELINGIESQKVPNTFDLVSLLIGVNNQYRNQDPEDAFRPEFRQLLSMATKFAKGDAAHVIVLSIPNWSLTPFGSTYDKNYITAQINKYNAIAEEECKKVNIRFINITPLSEKAVQDQSYLANDGLHYSGRMHNEWATMAIPEALKILK